ncbi:nuclear transport factor 2 family protein [Streptomyces sp. C]|uniref:nuclear transport factor 2 family protein n=1 Tax=Streptomyces sp. C TaxID=253839 RepID=UPI0001B4C696|nr:nuclear transport factor 2 family protein [Streptomyces sp. C]EFL19634.1 GdmX [Streptomyces sp. C]
MTYEDLSRRLRVLEDEAALRGLLLRGWRALDRKDWATWAACWAEDAELDFGPWGPIRGKEAIRVRVEEAEASFVRMQHHILNLHVEVTGPGTGPGTGTGTGTGSRAVGSGYMWFVAVTDPGSAAGPYSMGGPYDWEFRRDPRRGWLVVRQRLGVWWTTAAGGNAAPEAFAPADSTRGRGTTDTRTRPASPRPLPFEQQPWSSSNAGACRESPAPGAGRATWPGSPE